MGINPINPFNISPSTDGYTLSKQEMINKMEHLLSEYRMVVGEYDSNPHSSEVIKNVCACLYKLKDFLEKNKSVFFDYAASQGWPKYSTMKNDGYEGIYNACMLGINTFLNPSTRPMMYNKHTSGSPDFVNEQFTQLIWILQHSHGVHPE